MKISDVVIPDGFKSIPGWTNYYCNELGEIGSTQLYHWSKKFRLMRPVPHREGYLCVTFAAEKPKGFLIHRLVALLFIANPEHKPCVNHKNGIKTDNHFRNLEWVTYEENNIHSRNTLGFSVIGNKNPMSKFDEITVQSIRSLHGQNYSQHKIAKKIGVSQSAISNILNNKHWMTK